MISDLGQRFVARVRHRLRQGLAALRPRLCDEELDVAARSLSGGQLALFRRMSVHDQAHSLRVYDSLRRTGEPDWDVLRAGLLHDVGKVSERGRVRLADRVLKVLLRGFAPRLLEKLVREPVPWWREGLRLAVEHPRLGAELVAAAGGSERLCWLIANHESPRRTDPGLRRLYEADHHAY